jgi:hypothetical protein
MSKTDRASQEYNTQLRCIPLKAQTQFASDFIGNARLINDKVRPYDSTPELTTIAPEEIHPVRICCG